MWRCCALLVLLACNQVYSLDQTKREVDALNPGCPPIGENPIYSSFVTQALFFECKQYQVDPMRRRAVGVCIVNGADTAVEGVPDGPLAPAIGLPAFRDAGTGSIDYENLRLVDDRHALVQEVDMSNMSVTHRGLAYARGDDGTWRLEEVLPFGNRDHEEKSSVAYAADGAHILVTYSPPASVTTISEWVHRESGWGIHQTFSASDLGLSSIRSLSLSGDGLRLMLTTFTGEPWYTDRVSLEQPFRPATGPIRSAPLRTSLTMTADCERIYFTGLQSVFYSERR